LGKKKAGGRNWGKKRKRWRKKMAREKEKGRSKMKFRVYNRNSCVFYPKLRCQGEKKKNIRGVKSGYKNRNNGIWEGHIAP